MQDSLCRITVILFTLKQHCRKVQQSSMCEFLFPFRAHSLLVVFMYKSAQLPPLVSESSEKQEAIDEYTPTPL